MSNSKVLSFEQAVQASAKSFNELLDKDAVLRSSKELDATLDKLKGLMPEPPKDPNDPVAKVVANTQVLIDLVKGLQASQTALVGTLVDVVNQFQKHAAEVDSNFDAMMMKFEEVQKRAPPAADADLAKLHAAVADLRSLVSEKPDPLPAPQPLTINVTVERQPVKKSVQLRRDESGRLVGDVVEEERDETK